MADYETGEFHTADSGAATAVPVQCGNLKKNHYVVINERPCKIVEYSTSKTGKHGHAKAHIVAIDIFTGKKLEELCPTTHNMLQPIVTRAEYQLIDIDSDGFCSLMDNEGAEKNDLTLPANEVGTSVQKAFESGKDLVVTVIKSMGQEAIVSHKEDAN